MRIIISASPYKVAKFLSFLLLFFTTTGIIAEIFIFLNYPFGSSEWFVELFDLDAELNLPAWYSSFTLLFCSLILRAITQIKKTARDRYASYWKILANIFFFLALDEAFSLHELLIIPSLRESLNIPSIFYQTWVIVGGILVLIFLYSYLKFFWHLPKKVQRLFLMATLFYLGGALGMEMIGGYVWETYGRLSLAYALSTTVEEALEMLGIVVFIYGLLYYISSLAPEVNLQINFSDKAKP
jgi:hypothetical protein